jgi:hypothetical protein
MPRPLDSLEKKQQTVVERKQQFLQSRKHYLSRGIAPSEKLKRIAQDGGIALSELKGVLDKGTRLGNRWTAGSVAAELDIGG